NVTAAVGGQRMLAYQDQFTWMCGIAQKDWQYVVRICNIDVSDLIANTAGADLTDFMIKAVARIKNLSAGRAAFYMNRTVYEMLAIQRRDAVKAGGQLRFEVVDGKMIPFFMEIPIRRSDALLLTETRVI